MSRFHNMNSTGTVGILSESAAVERQGSLTMLGIENDKRPRTKNRIIDGESSFRHLKVILVRLSFISTENQVLRWKHRAMASLAQKATLFLLLPAFSIATRPPPCPCEDLPKVFTDFDGTISVNNTILNFAEAVYTATPPDKQTLPPLASLLAEYEANITRASDEYGAQDTIAQEVAFESSSLRRDVDVTLFDRVAAPGMISYLNSSMLQSAAEEVGLRDDFWDWAVAASRCGVITVLSNNFSTQWLRLILRTTYAKYPSQHHPKPNLHHPTVDLADKIEIYCPEILTTQLIPASPADHPTPLHDGGDKITLLRKLVRGDVARTLYLGDSVDDLPPLIGAGQGILMGNDSSLMAMLKKQGAELVPLVGGKALESQGENLILTTPDWSVLAEIYGGRRD